MQLVLACSDKRMVKLMPEEVKFLKKKRLSGGRLISSADQNYKHKFLTWRLLSSYQGVLAIPSMFLHGSPTLLACDSQGLLDQHS